jgi:broad specificity phosphatase PhoE
MSDNTKNYCTIYLVRHGETEWNAKNIVQGHQDSPLTEQGLAQAAATAQDLKDIKFDAIFSSDSPRAYRTAEIIKLERDLAIQTSQLLRERSSGLFEGKPSAERDEAIKDSLEQLKKLSEAERWVFKLSDDIESDDELMIRFIAQLREIAVAAPNKTIMVVTHGACIRVFLMKVGYATREQLPPRSFENAGYVKLLSDGVDFFVEEVKGIKSPKK